MKRLDNLSEIASRQLGGLEATPTLLAKIKLEAADKKQPRAMRAVLRPALAVCAALALVVGAVMTITPEALTGIGPASTPNVLDSHSAGNPAAPTAEPRSLSEAPRGVISMSAGMPSAGGTLFVQGENAAFPLITLNGATYRMLETPDAISPSLLGDELGAVTEFNIEPALGTSGVISNAAACGEPVYAIGSQKGALVAAHVNGALRVFQRVSYAGTAIIGTETLADTLCAPEDAAWISVEGLGRVDDPAAVHELMTTLLDLADYQSTAFASGASMQIGLKNGLTLQLMVGEDTISACGIWSCPDFFEAFAEAAK